MPNRIPRVNLLHAHGSPTRYLYMHRGCRCASCRASQAAYTAAYNAAHREKRRAYDAAYYAAHREEQREYDAAYNAAHRKERAAYRAARREEAAAYDAARYMAHCEERRAYSCAYNAAHREERRAYDVAYSAAHPEKRRAGAARRRARLANAPGSHTAADIAAQRTRQRGLCYWCNAKVGRHYHVDHVIPLALGGSNGPENLVIACPTCNDSKGAKHPMDFAGRML